MRLFYACAVSALMIGSSATWAQIPGGSPTVENTSDFPTTPTPVQQMDNLLSSGTAPSDAQSPDIQIPVQNQEATDIDRILQTQGGAPALSTQSVDPNRNLLDALTRARREGAVLRVSPESVFLNFRVGETGAEQIRLNNLGDTPATIRGINAISPIEGFLVTSGCEATLNPGSFCDIAVSFTSNSPREIFTAIVIGVEEQDRNSIEIPVQITVTPQPVQEQPVVPTTTGPSQQSVIDAQRAAAAAAPRAPTAEEIARAYYGASGGVDGPETGPMAVITLPESMRRKETPYIDTISQSLSVESITMDERYGDDIASTEASLPVDRSNIITADRVIKAVLDTSFSNVMCGKVVAVVESDVYSATSYSPLIPAGSRVLGRCGELVKERAGIVWERIITTDGRSISLAGENSMTRDASGLGGALGRVYRTPYDRYALPIFGTFVDIGAGFVRAIYGEDEQQSVTETGTVVQNTSARNEGINTATDAIQERSSEIIADLADVREVMVVPAGTRIDIEIFEDIYFKDSRQVVRFGDATYNVATPAAADLPVSSPYGLALQPYRPGLEGPVVQVNGRRYVVQEGTGLATIPSGTDAEGNPVEAGTAPTGVNGRPTASAPTASTENTLSDLNAEQ